MTSNQTGSGRLPLRLGVLDLVPQAEGATAEQAVSEAVLLARLAERSGYERYWAAEHHDLPGLACAAPEVLLAHIGAVTRHIRLGTGALLLPHYSPLKVAETFRLLAALNPGRMDLGIGRAPGGPAHASMALSGNFLQRVYGMEQSVQALIELLDGTYAYEGQPVQAKPVPAVEPELWMLGTASKSAVYAAQNGCGFVFGAFMSDEDPAKVLASYREAFVPSKRLAEPKTMMAVGIFCADTSAEAAKLARDSSRDNARPETPVQAPRKHQVQGTAEEAVAMLKQWQRAYNNEEFLVMTPSWNYEARRRSFELLGKCLQNMEQGLL
nr:MsnO8 family LLM class oxidoreductase [Paenibacillus physcomitrellae]